MGGTRSVVGQSRFVRRDRMQHAEARNGMVSHIPLEEIRRHIPLEEILRIVARRLQSECLGTKSLRDIGRDYWPMVRRTLFSGRVLLDDSLSW